MEISALFDNVDMAEFALVNLQSLGIFPRKYKIQTLRPDTGGEKRGDFLVTMNAGTGDAPPPREVRLLLTVDDGAEAKAQSALISNYARRVRIMYPFS